MTDAVLPNSGSHESDIPHTSQSNAPTQRDQREKDGQKDSQTSPQTSKASTARVMQTSEADIERIITSQRAYFATGATQSIHFRRKQLSRLRDMVADNQPAIFEALKQDLRKSEFETFLTEIASILDEIAYMKSNLARLMKPKMVLSPLTTFPATSYIYYEPYGMVLNIAPWNYPFHLSLVPIVGAIAAGNTIVLKPSEYAVHTSNLLARLVGEYFDKSYFAVIEGDASVNQAILKHKFDYIFFTGSTNVGKIVMRAASEHLTPVTLELGGKSPCIVDSSADIALAAKRIVWGKAVNSGQTCVAPDYLLVHEIVKDKLLTEMKNALSSMYGDNPINHPDFPKIISQKHYQRFKGFLDNGSIVLGGQYNDDTRQIAPTVLDGVTWDSPVMQEEIFGSILPLMTFETLEEVIEQVKAHPKPLALYLFTTHEQTEKRILGSISSGGSCINDTIMHIATHHMPFGGVGDSGMGGYHGKSSFTTFSHAKSVMKRANWLDLPLRYAPYGSKKIGLLKTFYKAK